MASARKMLLTILTWMIAIAVLYIGTFIGGVWWTQINKVILGIPVPAQVAEGLGNAFAIEALFYVVILALGIVSTYLIWQSTAGDSDYAQDMNYYYPRGPQ